MEGLLAQWALAIQEYELITIQFQRGHKNGNGDALSTKYQDTQFSTTTSQTTLLIHAEQLTDP